jgi:hypothetical protein
MRTVLLAALLAAVPVVAHTQPPSPAATAPSVAGTLAVLAASPDQPTSYRASVALHVRLRIFPFIRMTLHGVSMYQRPGLYRFVFHGVPFVARAFSDMKYDLGDPVQWPERYEIGFAPNSTPQLPVLRLTPKVRGLVKYLDVSVEPGRGHIVRATWSRHDGGVITLIQTYAPAFAGRIVVAKQDATIDLPRMKASLEADYADFRNETPASRR